MANKPQTIKIGNIKINKWESDKYPGTYSYTLAKSYKDTNNEWKDTGTFSASDLCVIKTLLDNVVKSLIDKPALREQSIMEETQSENVSPALDDEIPF